MQAEAFLDSLVDHEKIPGYDYDLNAFRTFLEKTSVPYHKLRNVIHIAGTKGKGSVVAMLGACLSACGYRVGSFTSPHLTRINERIQINGVEISDRQFTQCLRRLAPHLGQGRGARTFFETVTAVAFHHFSTHRTHFNILEVGLGGRLDATNVVLPHLSVITRIGYDHTHLLGNTLPAITREKTGILKPGGRLVTLTQRYTVQRIITAAARRSDNSIITADDQHRITIRKCSLHGMQVQVAGRLGTFTAFLPLLGSHQIENLKITLAILAELREEGFSIPTARIVRGLRSIHLHGRFEMVASQPPVIFDCAHNEDSFRALHHTLTMLGIRRFFLIFGSNTQKDIRYCVTRLFPLAREVVLVTPHSQRARDPYTILSLMKQRNHVSIASSVDTALAYLITKEHASVPIIITGSFYLWQKRWPRV